MIPNAETVRAHLKRASGLDPDIIYVTEVADVIDLQVVNSRSLLKECLHWLEQGEEPTYDQGLFGLFDKPATFDAAHRVRGWRLPDLEKEIGKLLGN